MNREAWGAAQVAYHISKRPFLANEAGPWVDEQREHLRTIFARACECLAEVYIWNGEPTVAVDVAKEVVAIHPFRETRISAPHARARRRGQSRRGIVGLRALPQAHLG